MGTSVATTGTGYLGDADLLGALTTMRADTIDVLFNTGTLNGAALRVDAPWRSASNVADATFRFTGVRPIAFDSLWVNKGSLTATTALSVTSLTMRDYLLLGNGSQTVALQGQVTAPAATRTVNTGALSAAKLAMTPASGQAPAVSINGISR